MENKLKVAKEAMAFRKQLKYAMTAITLSESNLRGYVSDFLKKLPISYSRSSVSDSHLYQRVPTIADELENICNSLSRPFDETEVAGYWSGLILLHAIVGYYSTPIAVSDKLEISKNKVIYDFVMDELTNDVKFDRLVELLPSKIDSSNRGELLTTTTMNILKSLRTTRVNAFNDNGIVKTGVLEILKLSEEEIIAKGKYNDVGICTMIIAMETKDAVDRLLSRG